MRVIALSATMVSLIGTCAVAQERPVLTVYTYDSFASEWGPGPAIEPLFEAVCNCDLQYVPAGDGASLLARLKLEGDRTRADVVVGLDTNLTAEAAESGLFAPHGLNPTLDLPVAWEDDMFLPFDWGWFAFVHRKDLNPPTSFAELAESDVSILIQDPRSSTPGLGLVLWVQAVYGDEAGAIWGGLADNIVTVTPGWSEAYGLFVEGEADMVLSYSTSPAYHLIAEEDDSFAAANFDEGHLLQIEVAAKVATTAVPELADAFLAFLLGDAAQAEIPTTNWMYPAVLPTAGLPKGFETLISPETSLVLSPNEAADLSAEAISAWREALSR